MHSCWARGWVASGCVPRPVPARDTSGPCPVPTPPVAAFLNWGVAEQDTAATHSFLSARNGDGDTHTHTHRGLFCFVSTRGKERAGGFKNKRICSALLKIEKVALKSSLYKRFEGQAGTESQKVER